MREVGASPKDTKPRTTEETDLTYSGLGGRVGGGKQTDGSVGPGRPYTEDTQGGFWHTMVLGSGIGYSSTEEMTYRNPRPGSERVGTQEFGDLVPRPRGSCLRVM